MGDFHCCMTLLDSEVCDLIEHHHGKTQGALTKHLQRDDGCKRFFHIVGNDCGFDINDTKVRSVAFAIH